jgi:hypothetical protein
VSADKVLKRTMWPTKEEVTEGWRKWQHMKLHNLYDLLIITIITIKPTTITDT